jgi:multisubunit Na+/H+ antiporter MnhG subunit
MRSVVVGVLLYLGVVLELFSVLGVCVMRDVFDRLHYVSLISYGAFLIGLSILVRESFSLIGDKAFLTGVVLVAVSPVLVHTTARSFRVRLFGNWGAGEEDFHKIEGNR